MHHVEHLFSNYGCFSVDAAATAVVGEGCSADAVLAVAGPAAAQMQHLRGLQCRCSVGSGRASSSTDVAFVQYLVGNDAKHQ